MWRWRGRIIDSCLGGAVPGQQGRTAGQGKMCRGAFCMGGNELERRIPGELEVMMVCQSAVKTAIGQGWLAEQLQVASAAFCAAG